MMKIEVSLPTWFIEETQKLPPFLVSLEERMRHVIRFAQLNIDHNTGGPFAAAVFEKDSGKVISFGINRVMASNCSSAHAEFVALSLAQQKLQSWDLGAKAPGDFQLVVNWRPCIMCYGSVIWSGVSSLAIAGSTREVEDITGFDEGPLGESWQVDLEKRGISVIDNVLKSEAIAVFKNFKQAGRFVYNSSRNAMTK